MLDMKVKFQEESKSETSYFKSKQVWVQQLQAKEEQVIFATVASWNSYL